MDKGCIITKLINGCGKSSILSIQFNTNSLTREVFNELRSVLTMVERYQSTGDTESIDGVIFSSKKNKIFLAGADLFEMKDLIDAPDDRMIGAVIDVGQETFDRISNLKIPTVACINGMCLGGGYELALACDYRIACSDAKIGLPEVNLGILPAWGGTTRLPPLVGLIKALHIVLSGTPFAAKPALKKGMIDKILHREHMVNAAVSLIRGGKVVKRDPIIFKNTIIRGVVSRKAKANVNRKTKGNYPAPDKIIDVMHASLQCSRKDALRAEKKAFLDLIKTPEMRNLLRVFFLQERSKKLKPCNAKFTVPTMESQAVVLGAGTMGAGIAQWLSSRGIDVLLKDINNKAVSAGLKQIGNLYVDGVRNHKLDRPAARAGLARVTSATDDINLSNKDIVIEAIVEKLDVKQKVLAQLEEKLSNDAIIATNTSALSIDDMAKCLKHPERFVGIHFFNPVHKMKLVEVVVGSKTSDETVHRAVKFVQSIGKLPVVVKDSPGFVVNRILVTYLVEATAMYAEGDRIQDIDNAMIKFGMPMGPFRLMDEIGLDVCYHVANDLRNRLDKHYSLEEIQWRLDSGRLGKKSGEGFYIYRKGKAVRNKPTKNKVDITRLVNIMTNEAKQILDEGVTDSADDIDFAMIMGTGYAPFRGGPLTNNVG